MKVGETGWLKGDEGIIQQAEARFLNIPRTGREYLNVQLTDLTIGREIGGTSTSVNLSGVNLSNQQNARAGRGGRVAVKQSHCNLRKWD